jgi:hypothetical protein
MSQEEPTPEPRDTGAGAPEDERRSYAPIFLKGCGFTLFAGALGAGVLFAARGDPSIIGAALFGVVFLLVILGTSGLTGFWND